MSGYQNHDRLASHFASLGSPLSRVWLDFMAEIGAEVRERNTLAAALAACEAREATLREAGQSLRDAFPDVSWQASRERAAAADEWDEVAS